MEQAVYIFRYAVLVSCLCALAAMGAYFAARLFHGTAKKMLGGLGGSWLVALAFVAGVVYYGGSKGIRWDTGLHDNGSVITNDTVEVRWTYSGIPSASSVFIDYREEGTTNEWRNLGETTATAGEWLGTLANATNYEYWIYSTYVPPVPVHTNGVWVGQAYETKARVGASAFVIINGVVEQHGKAIAPPSAKKKEDGKDEDD